MPLLTNIQSSKGIQNQTLLKPEDDLHILLLPRLIIKTSGKWNCRPWTTMKVLITQRQSKKLSRKLH